MTVLKQARVRRTISFIVIIQRFSLTERNILEYTERTTFVCYMQWLCWQLLVFAKVLVIAIYKSSAGSYMQRFCWQLYAKVLVVAICKVLLVATCICKGFQQQLYTNVLVVATCICIDFGCSYIELQIVPPRCSCGFPQKYLETFFS